MAITAAERDLLRDYALDRACEEFRQGKPCVQRKPDTKMSGALHSGCAYAAEMIEIIDRAE